MELYRQTGIEDTIHAAVGEQHRAGSVARCRNLSDPDVTWFDTVPWTPEYASVSPSVFCTCDQDVLEPILRDRARELGAEVHYGAELVEVTQDDHGVQAVVRDVATGTTSTIRAEYLVAADGTHSPIRKQLGIDRTGPGVLEHRLNVLFTTDLPATLQGRKLTACMCSDIGGALVPRETRPWLMSIPEVVDKEQLPDLIRKGVGHTDFTATIVDVFAWRPTALTADRYRAGRVFLTGDAATVMPPTGGFGGNTGIQSAHNLAWKLAAVTSGRADDALLDTYEAERRPVDQETVEEALLRLRSWYQAPGEPGPARDPRPDNTVMFGYRYASAAILSEEDAGDHFDDPREPTGRPGSRAAHVRLDRHGMELSTVDLFGRGFVLLTGPDAHHWQAAGQTLTETGELTASHQIDGTNLRDMDGNWGASYGVGPAGAALVRPDGFVAWRSLEDPADDPATALREVLDHTLRARATTRSMH